MKKRIQGIIIGIVIGIMISGVVTFAKTGTEALNAWYSNIKICINGEYITPTDANGNAVETALHIFQFVLSVMLWIWMLTGTTIQKRFSLVKNLRTITLQHRSVLIPQ